MSKDIFGFFEHQEKATMGLGYTLILRKNSDNAVLNKCNATNNAKIKINNIHYYVRQFTASATQQIIILNQIIEKWLQNVNI